MSVTKNTYLETVEKSVINGYAEYSGIFIIVLYLVHPFEKTC